MEQTIPKHAQRCTAAEYLRMEEASSIRHEFRDGELIAMAGGTFAHALIVKNVQTGINSRANASGCVAVSSDVRVQVAENGRYCYPDVVVVCGTPAFNPPDGRSTLVNPRLIVEVLSPSTVETDRGEKLTDYIGIGSLQEYVLVSQEKPRVDTFFRREDGSWSIGPWAAGLETAVTFRSLGITLPMAEVYAGVEFAAAAGAAV